MKRFIILLLTVFTFLVLPATADELPIREKFNQSKPTYSNKYSVVKFFQQHFDAADKQDMKTFITFYAPEYISNDGFNLETSKKIVEELWKDKPELKHSYTINSVSFYGDTAIVNISEYLTTKVKLENNQKGTLKSCSNTNYYLKKSGKSWLITAEHILSEEMNTRWGIANSVAIFMEAPYEVAAGSEYSAKFYIAPPTGINAIASISSEKITHPQSQSQDTYRRFTPDFCLERLLTANSSNTNEYAVAKVMFSPANDKNNSITGYACFIRRVNVVPKNNFIKDPNTKDETVKK